MSVVFDTDALQGSDSKLMEYFVDSEYAVRDLKVRPTYIKFHDLPQNNNYATFTLNQEDGTVTAELQHLSFNEANENSENEVWQNINFGKWIDQYDIIEILEQYVVPTKDGGKRKHNRKNTRKAKRSRKATRKQRK